MSICIVSVLYLVTAFKADYLNVIIRTIRFQHSNKQKLLQFESSNMLSLENQYKL